MVWRTQSERNTAVFDRCSERNLPTQNMYTHSQLQTTPRFPAVAFFSAPVHGMATLQEGPLKCFVGEWIDHAPLCTGLTSQEVVQLPSCDCSDRWPTLEDIEVDNNTVVWLGHETTYYAMTPSESMVSRGAGHLLTLQFFFTCE